jgi:hypothetical protein
MGHRELLATLILVSCKQPAPVIAADDARIVVVDAAPPAPPAPITRARGPLKGGFTLERSRFVAGEPIFVTLTATNTDKGAVSFDVGGDYRGSFYPIRYGVLVHDAAGKKVCDNRDPPPMSLGGLTGPRALPPGETFRETFAINTACDLFAAGRYKLTVIRLFAAQIGSDAGVHCDDTLARETTPPGTTAACAKVLDAAPMIATDLIFELDPYDATRVAATLDPWVTSARTYKDIGDKWERTLFMQWLMRRVTCTFTGPPLAKAPDVAPYYSAVIAALPKTPPKPCP